MFLALFFDTIDQKIDLIKIVFQKIVFLKYSANKMEYFQFNNSGPPLGTPMHFN